MSDGILLAAHLSVAPSDDDWALYCAGTHRLRNELRAVLVQTLGGGPNSKQREQVRLALEGLPPPPMAIMTGSTLVRGIITSLNWFMDDQLAAFELHDFEGAFAYLERGGSKLDRESLKRQLEALMAQLQRGQAAAAQP